MQLSTLHFFFFGEGAWSVFFKTLLWGVNQARDPVKNICFFSFFKTCYIINL